MIETAKIEGREGFQDRKLLLQIAGLVSSGGPGGVAQAAAAGAAAGSAVGQQLGQRWERSLNAAAAARERPPPRVIDHQDPVVDDALGS